MNNWISIIFFTILGILIFLYGLVALLYPDRIIDRDINILTRNGQNTKPYVTRIIQKMSGESNKIKLRFAGVILIITSIALIYGVANSKKSKLPSDGIQKGINRNK